MKQRSLIFLAFFIVIALLAGLNALSYAHKEKEPEDELTPNRSTFNSGATGTQAFYALLTETGHNTIRWRAPISDLRSGKATKKPSTFVIIGPFRPEITEAEQIELLKWIKAGGRLVVIDRDPAFGFCSAAENWILRFAKDSNKLSAFGGDPYDKAAMTSGSPAMKPQQPTAYSRDVIAVQPSNLAASITFDRVGEDSDTGPLDSAPLKNAIQTGRDQLAYFQQAPPPASASEDTNGDTEPSIPSAFGPVVHIGSDVKNLVVGVQHGMGEIIFLSDPYIVANGGIGIVDNSRLAINLVSRGDGLIAIDEFHHGYGQGNNEFLQFFEGTPVVPIALQLLVLCGLVFISRAQRFARPVGEPEPDRLSKLEYVSAMAELQRRTRAYDLAIENTYSDFRRRAARMVGADATTAPREVIAARIAERIGADSDEVDKVMFMCEDIVRGEPTNGKETVCLVAALREYEQRLGMKRTPHGEERR